MRRRVAVTIAALFAVVAAPALAQNSESAPAAAAPMKSKPKTPVGGTVTVKVTNWREADREEQLTWAKQRAIICVAMGHFSDAVAGLHADLAENPLTKGVVSSNQARHGYKAAIDAALGRGSQALTEWIESFR